MEDLLRTLEQKVDPANAALVVVDMQNDLCHPEGSFARMGVDVGPMVRAVPNVVQLTTEAKKVGMLTIYTQVIDTYMPAISPAYYEANLAFYESNPGDQVSDSEAVPWITPEFGEAFVSPIEPDETDVVIRKHRFGAFANTMLDQVLRSNGVRSLIIAGVITDVCVESTARAALDHDYYVVIPQDCTATISEARKQASLNAMGTFIGVVTDLEKITAIWSRTKN